jgi:hypothetical protein
VDFLQRLRSNSVVLEVLVFTSELSRFVRQGLEQKRTFKSLLGTLIETKNWALIKLILEVTEELKERDSSSSLLFSIAKEVLRELQRIQAIIPIKELEHMETSLIDIQYHHPDMKESLILEIPREWFCIGNEMFSPEFILRVLYYQPLPFVFDMRYTLEIMDNDLNMITMDSTQKMVLKELGYGIV